MSEPSEKVRAIDEPLTAAEPATIDEYLATLRRELAGADPALQQDALYDAEEYLRNATAEAASERERQEALARAVQRFGTPREVADAYRETDAQVARALAPKAVAAAADPGRRLLGVFVDPHAYGALLYMFLSLATGILYFTWAVTGLALSAGLGVLIVGLPFMLLFLASIRVFALLEGRVVESLLGVRMPRRPQPSDPPSSLWARVGARLSDRRTWTTLLYMMLKLPLGIFTFTVFTVLISLSLSLLAMPIVQPFVDEPLIRFNHTHFIFVPLWSAPLFWLASLVDLLIAMHLARALGRAEGALAKAMLVRREAGSAREG